jgi:hypothetical protein
LYVEDAPGNIECLERTDLDALTFTNSTNEHLSVKRRVRGWDEAEREIRKTYYTWRMERDLPLPPAPGQSPPGFDPKI